MTTKVRSDGGTVPPPRPPAPWPEGPSRSVAQRAAYTEAHQSTHTCPSGQEKDTRSYIVITRRQSRIHSTVTVGLMYLI